jgi:hypothetical protein
MPRYAVKFTEYKTGWISFDAKDLAEAEAVVEELSDYNFEVDDLQNGSIRYKDEETVYDKLEELVPTVVS